MSGSDTSRSDSPSSNKRNSLGKAYLKPKEGIKTKGFARSAQRRMSVLALGSIDRLQQFYAAKDLKASKTGVLGFSKSSTPPGGLGDLTEEPGELEDLDHLPTPTAPPPSFRNFKEDVETDLDVLLYQCHKDIQDMLNAWAIITGPVHADSELGSDEEIQVLPLVDTTTKAVTSVRNYTLHRSDLTNEALAKIRSATLELLACLKKLETRFRVEEDEESGSEDGYIYKTSHFRSLGKEREVIKHYIEVVQKYAFYPPHGHHLKPASFTENAALPEKRISAAPELSLPDWLDETSFEDDDIGRYHALLEANRPTEDSAAPLPDPHTYKNEFFSALCDGIILCQVYNTIIKRSKRPFGLISKFHTDTAVTYRAIENLKFFAGACKFRFDLTFDSGFNASDIARKNETGLAQLESALKQFCEKALEELHSGMPPHVRLTARRSTHEIPKELIRDVDPSVLGKAIQNASPHQELPSENSPVKVILTEEDVRDVKVMQEGDIIDEVKVTSEIEGREISEDKEIPAELLHDVDPAVLGKALQNASPYQEMPASDAPVKVTLTEEDSNDQIVMEEEKVADKPIVGQDDEKGETNPEQV